MPLKVVIYVKIVLLPRPAGSFSRLFVQCLHNEARSGVLILGLIIYILFCQLFLFLNCFELAITVIPDPNQREGGER